MVITRKEKRRGISGNHLGCIHAKPADRTSVDTIPPPFASNTTQRKHAMLPACRQTRRNAFSLLASPCRWFATTSRAAVAQHLPPRLKIPETDLHETFLKGSGPGGQKINKTASAVQLTHLPTGTVLKCQATRSRTQNRKIARQLLAEKIEVLEKGDESRAAIKADRASKKKASAAKKKKRKYRALEAEKNGESAEEVAVEGEEEVDGDRSDGGISSVEEASEEVERNAEEAKR